MRYFNIFSPLYQASKMGHLFLSYALDWRRRRLHGPKKDNEYMYIVGPGGEGHQGSDTPGV